MQEKDVDICITTYNRKDKLKATLDMLSKQTNQFFNLVINDDGSKSTINPVDYPIITKYIYNRDDNKYNRVARFNESILCCVSPRIILLDDDCVPSNECFIDEHLKCLEEADFSKGDILFYHGANSDGWFSTANLGFHKTFVKEYGIFLPEYNGSYGYEDLDLGEEIKRTTLKVVNNRNAQVLCGSEMYLDGDRSDTIVGRNRAIFQRRWN
jgi:glycosyltransferase involved in cell wall biosynthesis